ncbi:hypothetical protein [Celeribacter neptunius]|uniref:hypothetical protein n=1 Tax=Celeribacter neptunius TaxID=588602 RepID=UPI001C434BE0|nr:hypothetical protein [Celeribacter neptunius]
MTFTFQGILPEASFAEFAQHRAARLSIGLVTRNQSDTHAEMQVTGQADLLDAFEMAMSLGPRDCIVHEVFRAGEDADTDKGVEP